MNNATGDRGVEVLTAARLSGLSLHMITYLERNGITSPRGREARRGRARTYGVSDVLMLRLIGSMLAKGIEVGRLAAALQAVAAEAASWPVGRKPSRFVVTDGEAITVYRKGRGGVMTVPATYDFALVADLDGMFDAINREWP